MSPPWSSFGWTSVETNAWVSACRIDNHSLQANEINIKEHPLKLRLHCAKCSVKCSPIFYLLTTQATVSGRRDSGIKVIALLSVLGQGPASLLGCFWRKDMTSTRAAADPGQDHYPAFPWSFLRHPGLLELRKRARTENMDCPCPWKVWLSRLP